VPHLTIAGVRSLPDDVPVAITGTLTTALGALEGGRTAFVEDETGGVAIYLDAAVTTAAPAGSVVVARGITDTRYGQRTVRVALADVEVIGAAGLLAPVDSETGAAGEALEGRRIAVAGVLTSAPSELADGTAMDVDDGSGPLRIVVTPEALGARVFAIGDTVSAIGPLGQRDSTGSGVTGYRLYVTLHGDLVVTAQPSPTPTATPTPAPTAEATPPPTTTPDPIADPTPTPTPSWPSIAVVRAAGVGATVRTSGVVIAEAGRLGTPPLLAIGDGSGGIVVRLPAGTPGPARGAVVQVEGRLAAPYGQLEIRPIAGGLVVAGTGSSPIPLAIETGGLGEAHEGRLIAVTGRLAARPTRASSGDLTFRLLTAGGATIKVAADASSGIDRDRLLVGAEYRVIGVVGQRASRSGASDGYRVWARDPGDLTVLRQPPSPTPRPSRTPKPTATPRASGGRPSGAVLTIAAATRITSRDVTVEGVVTAPSTLLDATGRRIVIQDSSGAIEVLIPKDEAAPRSGRRVRVEGRVGAAYGSPRIRADAVDDRGPATQPAARSIHGAIGTAQAWRLVRVEGRIDDVRRLGGRWRAELVVGRDRVVVLGQPGAGIPADAIVEGRTAAVTGIVRLAYPSATDRRPSVLPRSRADVRVSVGASGVSVRNGPGATDDRPDTHTGQTTAGSTALAGVPDADLSDLATHDGTVVRVGGLVGATRSDGFDLDDGTATGRVVLTGEAAAWATLVEPGDAINVTGLVTRLDGVRVVVVDDPALIVLGSDLMDTAADMDPVGSASASSTIDASGVRRHAAMGDGGLGLPGAGAGLATLLALAVTSLLATFLRRRHARRLLASRVATRLAALGRPAERGPSVGPPP
jgi:DNA/RNA endonuclease YhcR with UshA esterase domain